MPERGQYITNVTSSWNLTWVTVSEEGAHRQQDLRDSEGGAPVVLKDVEADHALTVDVAVVDASAESHLFAMEGGRSLTSFSLTLYSRKRMNKGRSYRGHLWRFEGIFWREVYVKEEHATLIHRTGRAQYGGHPLIDVVSFRASTGTNRIDPMYQS